MSDTTVAVTVDCTCASQTKCFVSSIVSAAEQGAIPLTWLIGVQEHDPLTNASLYHREYLHRIPAWHELGLYLTFDATAGSTVERGDLIRLGKDVLKQYSIKPTAFRAAQGDLQAGDVKALEDVGILVDATPGSSSEQPNGAPQAPYHPAYDHVHEPGPSKLWVVPVAGMGEVRGYVDAGIDRLKPILDASLKSQSVLCLGMTDCQDNGDHLRNVADYLKKRGARFVTLTQLVTEQSAA